MYRKTLEFLYNALPEFQQVGADAYKPGLERVSAFLRRLDEPQRSFRAVHIAGTNGKGSTSHILAAVLMAAGYRVGLYTSPHLRDFRERIRIDGATISEQEVVEFVERHRDAMEGLSFFEMTVGMAFERFRAAGVDVAVVETGLGGRLDATNVITPVLSVITNIGLDHTALLGDTIPQIAAEKAGIIKAGVPVVVGERSTESDAVFEARASELDAPLIFAQDVWRCSGSQPLAETQMLQMERVADGSGSSIELDLLGEYQRKNIVTCLAAIDTLNKHSTLQVPPEAVAQGCIAAARSTGLLGRWQKLGERPLIIADTGHNEHGIREVAAQIVRQHYGKLYMVVGFAADKDVAAMLRLLPRTAYYLFTQPSSRRALPATELARLGQAAGLEGEVAATVPEALARARNLAALEDMIFVGGSNFVVAEI